MVCWAMIVRRSFASKTSCSGPPARIIRQVQIVGFGGSAHFLQRLCKSDYGVQVVGADFDGQFQHSQGFRRLARLQQAAAEGWQCIAGIPSVGGAAWLPREDLSERTGLADWNQPSYAFEVGEPGQDDCQYVYRCSKSARCHITSCHSSVLFGVSVVRHGFCAPT